MRVVRLRRNFGKAAALVAGFDQAQGEVVVTIDGDLQDDPAEIPRLLAKLDEGFDLVSGWKTHRRDPISRRLLSRIFNRVTSAFSGVRLHDMNCGLKAYRAEVVHGLRLYGELHRFIPVLAHYRGFRIAELPVNHRPREHGRSRYGVERYLRGFLDLLTVSFIGRYRHRPLHLFGGLGLLLGLIGSAILVYLTVIKALGHAIGQRPLLMLGVLLVVIGMQFFSLGLISEMITSHHEERVQERDRVRAARRRSPLLRVCYFGTYERGYPRNAQVISCLRGAGVEVVEEHVSVWDDERHGWGAGPARAFRLAAARSAAAHDAGGSTPTRSSSAIPDTSTCLPLDAPRAAGRSSSTRSSHSWTRSSRIAVGSGRARSRHALSRQSTAGHFAPPTSSSQTRRPMRSSSRGLQASMKCPSASSVPRTGCSARTGRPPDRFVALFVGKLIPLQGVETILQAAREAPEIAFRVVGSGQLERAAGVQAAERRARAVDRVRAPAGGDSARGLLARNLRDRRQGAACHPEQGVPGHRMRGAARDRRHACRPRVARRRGERTPRPGRRRGALAGAVRRLAADSELSLRIAAGGRAAYEQEASEAVLGVRWRTIIEGLSETRQTSARLCASCSRSGSPRTRLDSPRSRYFVTRLSSPVVSTSGTWCRPCGRPRTATPCG